MVTTNKLCIENEDEEEMKEEVWNEYNLDELMRESDEGYVDVNVIESNADIESIECKVNNSVISKQLIVTESVVTCELSVNSSAANAVDFNRI